MLAIVFACAMLLSTAPADRLYEYVGTSAHLIKTEYKDILSFFGKDPSSTDERGLAAAASADEPSTPELSSKMHTEVLPSPFNRSDKAATVASLGDGDLCDLGTTPLTQTEKLGRAAVPVFTDRSASAVSRILSAHGIAFTTVSVRSTAPAGEVFAIRYAGKSDESGYFINPNIAVTLYVSEAKEAQSAVSGDNLVCLTFDDGPNPAHLESILDILDTYGIKGAFFTLGTSVESHPELAREVVIRGHTLGCHTMTHVYDDIYSSAWALENEIDSWEAAVAEAGIDLDEVGRYFRFPGGSVSPRLPEPKLSEMKAMLSQKGYKIYDWNASINDAVLYLAPDGVSSYDYIRDSFIESLDTCLKINENKDGEPVIILMHENGDETPELLTWLIEYLRERGLSFGSLSSLGGSWTFSER